MGDDKEGIVFAALQDGTKVDKPKSLEDYLRRLADKWHNEADALDAALLIMREGDESCHEFRDSRRTNVETLAILEGMRGRLKRCEREIRELILPF